MAPLLPVTLGGQVSAIGTAVGLSAGLIAMALAAYAVAALAKSRHLPLSGMIGIRTRATRRSEASWIAGHDAARSALLTAAVIGVCGAATTVPLGLALASQQNGENIVLVLGLSTYVVVLALLGLATSRANTAAREVR